MAVPKVDGQFIAEAIKYIDENGVPWHNTSTKYKLVWENGNTYPPKYVIAVANHLQNGKSKICFNRKSLPMFDGTSSAAGMCRSRIIHDRINPGIADKIQILVFIND